MYKEPQALNSVAEFHKTFHSPILNVPTIPKDRIALRISLLQEELNELKEALNNDDIVETADALGDLQYVLSGAVLEFGLANHFKEVFDEIQRSNMSKACKTEQEAIDTVTYYTETKGVDCYYEKDGEVWLVFRDGDKKTLKSVGYSPANLKSILEL